MNSPTPPVEDVLTRLRYCAAHGMFKAVEDDKHASYSEAADVIEALRTDLQRAREALDEIGRWRKDCHAHDADMGHELRDFDAEDWDMVEQFAKRAAAKVNTISSGPEG